MFIFCVAIIIIAWVFYKNRLDDEQNLYRKVAWIAVKQKPFVFSGTSRLFELIEIVELEHNNLNIDEQFRLDFSSETEKENLTKILNTHKEHVIKSYFHGLLAKSNEIYALNELEYYFFSLNSFLYDTIYDVNAAYTSREQVSDNEFKYQLTDYGRVYYKLHLVTSLYIEKNEHKVKKLFKYIDKEQKNRLMEALEKNEVLLYRPF